MGGVALVTGCSTGIGLRTALTLARAGYGVHAGVRDPDRANELRDAIEAERLDIVITRLDVTDRGSVDAAVADAGEVDVLVNNAGVGTFGSVELMPDAELRLAFETNFFGAIAMLRAVLPGMRARGRGVVVTIGSVDALLPGRPMTWAYAASKHAMGVAAEGLALEVEPFGVRVRQIDPGFFATSIRDNRLRRAASGTGQDGPYAPFRTAMERAVRESVADAGDPHEVADAVLDAIQDERTFPVRRIVGADAQAAVASVAALDEEAAARAWKAAVGMDKEWQ